MFTQHEQRKLKELQTKKFYRPIAPPPPPKKKKNFISLENTFLSYPFL